MPKGSKRLAALLAAAFLAGLRPCSAGGPGSAGANFLKFAQGPRAVAMGESQVAAADDAYSAYWNPAGLAAMRYPELAMTHNKSFEGVDQQYLSLAYPLKAGSTLDLNLTRLAMSPFQGYDAQGVKTGEIKAGDYALGLAYGRTILRDERKQPLLNMGLNVKGIQENLDTASAKTFAADAGVIYYLRRDLGEGRNHEWRLGFAVKNVGPGLKFDEETSELPRSYQLGVAWLGHPKGDRLTFSLDQVLSRDEGYYMAAGAEYMVQRMIALRMGYRTGQDIGLGFRAGVGFKLKRMEVDYAYAGFGDLGQMHRVGVSVRLGGMVEVTPPEEEGLKIRMARGRRLMQEGRAYEAILEFNKILDIDPGNKEALEQMRKANEKLKP